MGRHPGTGSAEDIKYDPPFVVVSVAYLELQSVFNTWCQTQAYCTAK